MFLSCAISEIFPIISQNLKRSRDRDHALLGTVCRDVKSSRPSWPRDQNFGLGLGLGLEALASASALTSNYGLGLGLGLEALASAWPRPDIKVCGFDHNSAYVVTYHLVLFNYLTLSFPLASTSRNWPRSHSPGLGLASTS